MREPATTVTRIPILSPIDAYRLDLERGARPARAHRGTPARRREREGVRDAVWNIIGNFFFIIGNAPQILGELGPSDAGRLLTTTFGSEFFPIDHDAYHWVAEFRDALMPTSSGYDLDRVMDTAVRMAEEIEAAGLPIFAFNTLDAVGVAIPPDDPHAVFRLFMGLGGIAERFGAIEQARDSYQNALEHARETHSIALTRDAQRAARRLGGPTEEYEEYEEY
jgi:hypothetical protein